MNNFVNAATTLEIEGHSIDLFFKPQSAAPNKSVAGEYLSKDKTIWVYGDDTYENLQLIYKLIKNFNSSNTEDIKKRIYMFLTEIYSSRSVIGHELVHFLDDVKIQKKSIGKKNIESLLNTQENKNQKTDKQTRYINSTWEVNAKLLEHIFIHWKIDNFSDFLQALNKNYSSIHWISSLTPKNKRRVMSRIYQYYMSSD